MRPYLLISGDFVQTGGMDAANYALASYLARGQREVHLVSHRVAPDLAERRNVTVHHALKPANAYLLGAPFLASAGFLVARRLGPRAAHAIANGGNCPVTGLNWVHYVHAAYAPREELSLRGLKGRLTHRLALSSERRALGRARAVITNSEVTRQHVIDLVGVAPALVHTIYYGIDAARFQPSDADERLRARAALGWSASRNKAIFIGALGDRRKGFDTLFRAWEVLCADPKWDVDLVVIGSGAALPAWRERAVRQNVAERIQFLGFRSDVPDILRACDMLVSPTRYEAYGLAIHEALCCGLPALASASSGIAERYPKTLRDLLIADPDDADELVAKLRGWRSRRDGMRDHVASFGHVLRARTWDHMAKEIEALADATP